MNQPFNKDYFLHGEKTGVSNYTDYRWMPELTIRLAQTIYNHLGMCITDSVLDYGCARGYLVRAFIELGVRDTWGADISKWAVDHCDLRVRANILLAEQVFDLAVDWTIAKDVLEHIPEPELSRVVEGLLQRSNQGMFIVVPLTDVDGGSYVGPRDNQDATHVIRWTLPTWLKFLRRINPFFVYQGSFHIPGIKQASEPYEGSCGFITAKRIK